MATGSGSKRNGRSAITNGSAVVAGVDQRSTWCRRLRDLVQLHLSDLGGEDNVSEAEKSLIRRVAVLSVEMERMEAAFAVDEAEADALDAYQRASNSLRRLLTTLGLKRRARDITPSLSTYIRKIEAQKVDKARAQVEAADA